MPKIRVRREKFVQAYCPRDAPMVSAPICIRCLDFFANDFTMAAKFEVVCSLMVNPSICGDICHTDFISAKAHRPCDPSYTDAECTRWADLMKRTEKMTDDDYNRTVSKIMDTIPNESVEEVSPLTQACNQPTWSPTSVTNIDGTEDSIIFKNNTLPDAGNFTIEESKTLIEEEMICLDQYYHHQQASMSTAAFIMIVLVCSLLTGMVVFAVLNFLWKKFRSRRFEENRSAPRTARDEEVYIAGQKT